MITIKMSPDKTKLMIVPSAYEPRVITMIANLPGKRWYKPYNAWMMSFSKDAVTLAKELLEQVTIVNVHESVTGMVENEDKRAQAVVEFKSKVHEGLALPENFKFFTEPMQHQKTAFSLGIQNRGFAYFMEMGTGKTKVILDLVRYFLPQIREHKRPVLVISPVVAVGNWAQEAKKHAPELLVQLLQGSLEDRVDRLMLGADVFVINYDSVWRVIDELAKIKWGMVVLDESTRIKHRTSKRAKAVIRLGKLASRKYILTGTPQPNSPLELYNQIRFINPAVFGENYYLFERQYAIKGGFGGYQILGWRNLEELSRKISGVSFRVLKRECLDLPPKVYKVFRIPMAKEQSEKYKELAEELVTEVGGNEIRTEVALAKLSKLRQIASGFVYHDTGRYQFTPNNKLEKLEEILDISIITHKFVIWVSFDEEMEIIRKLLEKKGIKHVTLNGSTPGEVRTRRIAEFQEDESVRIFLSNQRAGGVGINLTAGDYCVFFSNDYSPEIRLQAEDRLHRIGQRSTVTYIDLISKATIDSTIYRMLLTKQDLSAKVMSGNVRPEEMVYGGEDDRF